MRLTTSFYGIHELHKFAVLEVYTHFYIFGKPYNWSFVPKLCMLDNISSLFFRWLRRETPLFLGRTLQSGRQYVYIEEDTNTTDTLTVILITLGRGFENLRSDRNEYIKVLWNNVISGNHYTLQYLSCVLDNDLIEALKLMFFKSIRNALDL